MKEPQLPDYVTRIGEEEKFSFACHPGVKCFTHCCRELELALTPYDLLRLRKATGLRSRELIDQYIIIEQTPVDVFPRLYLTMVDDGKASCVFVSDKGCTVYDHRPGACRAYPSGRGAMRNAQGKIEEFFVLLKEEHCHGFEEQPEQDVSTYSNDQGLQKYNTFNDKIAQILQHEQIRQGKVLTKTQVNHFTLALYDIDTFKDRLIAENLPDTPALTESEKELLQDDEQLLLFGIKWITSRLFSA